MAKSFIGTTIGKKYLVALTGLFLVLFNLVHMAGNLQMFGPPEKINSYAEFLQGLGPILWVARIGLLALLVVHVSLAIQLVLQNRAARPIPYQAQATVQASLSSRTMAISGSIILLYVLGHLAHFTAGWILPEYYHFTDPQGRHDVYTMVVKSFQITPVSLFYIGSMCLLWSHLAHGISSIVQTSGFRSPRIAGHSDLIGKVLSAIIVGGYISIPLSVILGIIPLHQ